MSKIKEQKTLSSNELNLVDLFELICPVKKKSKYVETWIRLIKTKYETPSKIETLEEFKDILEKDFNIKKEQLNKYPNYKVWLVYLFFEEFSNMSEVKSFQKFCEFNELDLIKENDLTRYNSFDQISQSVGLAELKNLEKELETQTKKIYEDDEWLMIRPLTYYSSKKYGSSTKWCTTMEHSPEYFNRYSRTGILIYNLNKKTGLKVGMFKSLEDCEFSFWNQTGDRIDSMDSGLPNFMLMLLKKEINENEVTNFSYLTNEEQIKEFSLMGENKFGALRIDEPPQIYNGAVRRRARILNDLDENETTEPDPNDMPTAA